MYVPLDGSFFTANEFKESLLAYNGGPLHLDATNNMVDSDLVVGSSVKEYSNELSDLKRRLLAGQTPNFDPKRLFPLIIRR